MNLTTQLNQVTMTSLELVAFLNTLRGNDESEIRHDNFMIKVPKVLGELTAPKFLGTDFYSGNGGTKIQRAIYNFPKHEAMSLAMSYRYDYATQVYDHMTALEAQMTYPKLTYTKKLDITEAAEMIEIAGYIATALRVSESARLGMVRTVITDYAPKALKLLPIHLID